MAVRSHCFSVQLAASAPVSEQKGKMFSFLLLHFVFIYETKAECTAVYYFGEKLQPKPDLFFRIWQHNRSPLSLKSAAPHVSSVALIRWVLISHRSVPSIRFKLDFASAAGFLLSNSYWIIKGEATLRLCCIFVLCAQRQNCQTLIIPAYERRVMHWLSEERDYCLFRVLPAAFLCYKNRKTCIKIPVSFKWDLNGLLTAGVSSGICLYLRDEKDFSVMSLSVQPSPSQIINKETYLWCETRSWTLSCSLKLDSNSCKESK